MGYEYNKYTFIAHFTVVEVLGCIRSRPFEECHTQKGIVVIHRPFNPSFVQLSQEFRSERFRLQVPRHKKIYFSTKRVVDALLSKDGLHY